MAIRGFNATKETNEILDSLDIPKMQFSKKMNGIIKEWHIGTKQEELNKLDPKPEVKLIG